MKKILFLLFFLVTHTLNAQNQANIWYFGEFCGLDFNSGSPVVSISNISNLLGESTICDTNGNLLIFLMGIKYIIETVIQC